MEKSLSKHKEEHIRFCLEKDVESCLTTGFERFYLINEPLPERDFDDLDVSTSFLGKRISAPLIISPMTGGVDLSIKINKNLAKAAQELGVVMSVGSQRLGLEDPQLMPTYQVRDVAPNIPLLANLGAIYLNYGYGLDECERAIEMIGADGLYLYLNPMQKLFQGTDKLNFKGLVEKIGYICQNLSVPVVVKEVGFGISPVAATLLQDAGVSMMDVAGAGGTSWVKVTRYMKDSSSRKDITCFDDWGIPSADSLIAVRKAAGKVPLIASGGIRTGVQIAKALALGASYAGMALPLLAPAMQSSEAVKKKMESVIKELKIALFGCGAGSLDQLRNNKIINPK